MLHTLGRGLQLVGLILVPLAIAGNLAEFARVARPMTLQESLTLSSVGILSFTVGWFLQQRTKAS